MKKTSFLQFMVLPLTGLLAASPAHGQALEIIQGPLLAQGGGVGPVLINAANASNGWITNNPAGNGLPLNNPGATGTYYFGFDWTVHDNNNGGMFGGLWFYEGGTERSGFGAGWNNRNYAVAGGSTSTVTPKLEFQFGQKVRIVGKIQYKANQDAWLEMWVNPVPGVGEDKQTGVPYVFTTRNMQMNEIHYRTGNGTANSVFENLVISQSFEDTVAWDADGDGLPDAWERRYGFDPSVDNSQGDPDGDGIPNIEEFLNGLNPINPDTDGDGLNDGEELLLGTDPRNPDTDGDGLLDGVETNTGTFVDESDTGTDPLNPDTDGDGAPDGLEVRLGSDPTDPDSVPDPGNLEIVGLEHFDYPNHTSLGGQTGGEYFDYDNSEESSGFVGHTKSSSSWEQPFGQAKVIGGKLYTGTFPNVESGGVLRYFNGPHTSNVFGSDAREGMFSFSSPYSASKTLYFAVRLKRGNNTTWSGVSLYSFGAERAFFGRTSGSGLFGIEQTNLAVDRAYTNRSALPWQEYLLVGKVDFSNGADAILSLWVDPELGAAETTPDVTTNYIDPNALDITGIRLASNGLAEWDDYVVATTWEGLQTSATDSDGDGLRDTWELAFGLNPNDSTGDNGGAGDPDHDTVTNLQEQARGSDPHKSDTDEDGLPDAVETNTGVWVSASDRGTNPSLADSDWDGLDDVAETNTGTFVDMNDTGTNPNLMDTDGDGFPDSLEIQFGSSPFDPSDFYGGNRGLIGADDFSSYTPGEFFNDLAGGEGFDYDNNLGVDLYTGHTGTTSKWTATAGFPTINSKGKLEMPFQGIVVRPFNGPLRGTAATSDELAGAVNGNGDFEQHHVYLRADVTRDADVTESTIVSYDFTSPRTRAGVLPWPNPVTGKYEFGVQVDELAIDRTVYSGIEPQPGKTYTMVVKIDYSNNRLSLWVNPDLTKPEPAPTVSEPLYIGNWTTALGLQADGSGTTEWANAVAAYHWNQLGIFPGHTDALGATYASWIADWSQASPLVAAAPGFDEDADHDGIPNGLEQILGTRPDRSNSGLEPVSSNGTTFVFRHSQTNDLPSDVQIRYQWSTDLVSWHASGDANGKGVQVGIVSQVIEDNNSPENDLIEVTATVSQGATGRLFLRLAASK